MFIEKLKSKIHRATVTEANLNYVGSITIDAALLELAEIQPYEKVSVVNINNGQRFETYAMEGAAGSGVICLNGAAARLCQAGDLVIIMSYCTVAVEVAKSCAPTLLFVDSDNRALEPAP